MLTGKTLEKFEKWYFKKFCKSSMKYEELLPHHKHEIFDWFYNLEWQFKIGVLDAFFNKHGLYPHIVDTKLEDPENWENQTRYHTVLRTHEKWMACGFHKNKIKAEKEAIEVANEKFNLKYL